MLEIKKIVSTFIGKEVDEIHAKSIVDKTAVKGSILIHRMYASLASKGFYVSDYASVKYYSDILERMNMPSKSVIVNQKEQTSDQTDVTSSSNIKGIGIDIENISSMPITDDFRVDEFYIQNFSLFEISYCILKENPYASFAGLFSLKEAIYKSNSSKFKVMMFNQIEITHSSSGAPMYSGYILSLSHTQDTVVAVSIAI